MALALGWGIYLISISQNGGEILSTEYNRVILHGEIILTGFIAVFALVVAIMELNRLSSRRSDEKTKQFEPAQDGGQGSTQIQPDSNRIKNSKKPFSDKAD